MLNLEKAKLNKAIRRKNRTRAKISGTAIKPRASVFRSAKYIYIQLIDDQSGKTLVSASSRELKAKGKPMEIAMEVGKLLGKKAAEKKILEVVFDRNRYKYHGRVKALADGIRESGLKF